MILIVDMRLSTSERSFDRTRSGRAPPARSPTFHPLTLSGSGNPIASAVAEQLGVSLSTLHTEVDRKVRATPQAVALLALAALPEASVTERAAA